MTAHLLHLFHTLTPHLCGPWRWLGQCYGWTIVGQG